MANPYSYDLRQKVMQAIERDGMKKSEVSQLFNLSRNTINLWCQRQAATGDFQAKKHRPPGNGHKITDWDKFRKFVSLHGDGGNIEQMIRDAGCEVWYLPPYSPDLNLIERCWSWLKSRIRKKLAQADSLRDAMEDVLRAAS